MGYHPLAAVVPVRAGNDDAPRGIELAREPRPVVVIGDSGARQEATALLQHLAPAHVEEHGRVGAEKGGIQVLGFDEERRAHDDLAKESLRNLGARLKGCPPKPLPSM
jgi:hypothetical protein